MRKAEEILKEKKLSITAARSLVLSSFIKAKRPISVKDLKKKKSFDSFNESSLYRNIAKLESAGIIHSIPSAGEHRNFELIPTGHHHHHISCVKCKKVECLNLCGLESRMTEMAESAGFSLTGHNVELMGVCSRCRAIKI